MLFVVGTDPQGPLKIGHAIEPARRLHDVQAGNPQVLKVLATGHAVTTAALAGWSSRKATMALHRALKEHQTRPRGDWFTVDLQTVLALFPRGATGKGHIKWEILDAAKS